MAGSIFKAWSSVFPLSDEQAMWRVQTEDDHQAFAMLMQRWQNPIRSLCARMLGDVQRGEDLAQEAFAKVFDRRKDYEHKGKFSSFLWRVALNLCYDELRRVKRRREAPMGDEEEATEGVVGFDAPGPDFHLVEQERAEAVRRALLRLDEPYRVVVVLRHYEGLKFREIGELLEIPEGTVKSRMVEALNQLNRILSHSLNESEVSCKTTIPNPKPSLTL